jgi:hypothetical protein
LGLPTQQLKAKVGLKKLNNKEIIMDEEKIKTLDELTLYLNMDLNILHNALKYVDTEELDIAAVSYFVENIYKNSCEIRKVF